MSDFIAQQRFTVRDYDLAATLTSGQAFRWQSVDGWWEGVVKGRWVRLRERECGIEAEAVVEKPKFQNPNPKAGNAPDTMELNAERYILHWKWLTDYLQLGADLESVLLSFPDDEPMHAAVSSCRGLRLLRQDPWECLASFILSSTKQIVQIQQIVGLLCERLGEPVLVPRGHSPVRSFPSAERLAACAESELRACKMGFRAPNLLRSAQIINAGEVNLATLHGMPLEAARTELIKLPGVGNKIANCVLLFAYGFQQAFPVDVWVKKALKELYFPKRRVTPQRLERFANTHFGANAGYAQQYLFHYMRVRRAEDSKTQIPDPR